MTTAFVTGASYGIGAACALALARDGFDVVVSELDPKNLADTVAKSTAAGVRALPVELDLRSLASIEHAMKEVLGSFGALDVLVNSAGVTLGKPALEMTGEEWDAVLDVTVETPTRKAFFDANPGRREVMTERVPLRRFGTAEEMAGAVAYLASPQAAYITGQTLLLDGGLTAY